MKFVAATIRGTRRTKFINMANVMTMVSWGCDQGTFTEIKLVNGDVFEVYESPEELINGVM